MSVPGGLVAVLSIVVCAPSVSLAPHTTSAASPPSFCGTRTRVAISRSPFASAATKAGRVLSGPSVSTVRSVCRAVRAGTAHSASARPATVTADTRNLGSVTAVSSVTSAAPTTPAQARLKPVPGQISTGTPFAKLTTTPTATNAVARPVIATARRVMPAPHRGAIAAARASSAIGTMSSGAQTATAGSITSVQPARSEVGNPVASSNRPALSPATCGPAHASPGSAKTAQRSPYRTCQITSGANSTAVGASIQSRRTAPWNQPRVSTITRAQLRARHAQRGDARPGRGAGGADALP